MLIGSVRVKLTWVSLSLLTAAYLTRFLMYSEQAMPSQSDCDCELEKSRENMKVSEHDLESMAKAIRGGRFRSQDLVKVG